MPSGIGTVVRDLLADLQEGRGGGGGVDARRMDGLKMGCMARSFQRLGKWERLLMTGRWKGTKSVRVLVPNDISRCDAAVLHSLSEV